MQARELKICEILTVGTELLLGEILNTNARFLCKELAAMGIGVQRVLTVGDNPARLREDFLQALGRSDIVLCSGGLGPTPDDLTKEVVCEALGLPLAEDAAQRQAIKAFFARHGAPCSNNNFKQALVPQGCTVLYNENGTAPGCCLRTDEGKIVALLPGPPRELQPMFIGALRPLLRGKSSGAIVSHHLRTYGIGESRLAALAAPWLACQNPTVAPYAKDGEAYLRITAAAPTNEAAEALCAPVLAELQNLLKAFVYSVDKNLSASVLHLLKSQAKTISFAESCTGGAVAKSLTDLPGASEVFGYGFVCYANEAKQRLLGVAPTTLATHGAVSAECAEAMAHGARAQSGADLAVSVTGVAGPSAQGTNKPAGLVYLAATNGNQTLHRQLNTGRDDRDYNRTVATKAALHLAWQLLTIS
ncbi:MAG: competence/damage-inducible protein A [Oscillospiraceae bacterium]|jgi:nicotinamide-nucleotide amidase|nr:competence/damage-inducible protein A [Oscillospiraceae bacterium]